MLVLEIYHAFTNAEHENVQTGNAKKSMYRWSDKKASTKQVVSGNEMNFKITVKMVVFKSEIEQFDCDFKLQFTFKRVSSAK